MVMRRPVATPVRQALIVALALLPVACGDAPEADTAAGSSGEVNLYTTREPGLIQPLLDAFTESTGIVVNTVFVRDGLLERLRAEGELSPADILMTVDYGNLLDLVEGGHVQPIRSEVLESAIPSHLRDAEGRWFALSMRDRVLYADRDMDLDGFAYEDL